MSFRKTGLSRSLGARRSHLKKLQPKQHKHRSALRPALPSLPGEEQLFLDEQVLSFRQWCVLNGFSERTGRRVLASGNGPVVIQLSEKRIGITVGNNRAWQQARARA
jgi:hypothetical protein